MSDGFILSVMGESEIETFEVQLKNKRMSSQVHDTIEDQVNWLGSIQDVGADTNLTQAQKENIAYIAESFVLDKLKSDFITVLLNLKVITDEKNVEPKKTQSSDPKCLYMIRKNEKISRNEKCPATGKKFKNCCGAL